MKKSTRIVKRSLALFLVVLMSINTFAAVVGDNDGAAFITKAEFDSLKNDFQSQLDTYNSSIDNKIDGAIASYLAGITITKKEEVKTLIKKDYEYLESFGVDNWLPLRKGGIKGEITVGQAAIGIGTHDVKGIDGTKQGVTVTKYTSKENELTVPSLRATENDKKFYNLNLVFGNIDVNASRFTTAGSRWLTDGYTLEKQYIGINNQRYWYTDKAETFHNNYATARSKNAFHYIGPNIKSLAWVNNDNAKYNPELMIYYDSTANERKILAGYSLDDTISSSNTNSFKNFVSWRAYYHYPGNDKNNSWTNGNNGNGYMASTEAKWELDDDPQLTLAVLSNYEYKVPTVVWPMDLNGGYIIQTCTDRSTKDTLKFDLVAYYQWFYETTDQPGYWKRDTTNSSSAAWADDFVATDKGGDSSYTTQNPDYYHVNPYDWTWRSYIISDIDQRPLFKWNKDILTDNPSTTLENYMKNYDACRGVPIYEASKNGEFEFEPVFTDTTKQYNIWVCKGPANTDFDSAVPTNTYQLKNLTQNSNKSYTINSGAKLKLDVEKGDVVYILWCEKDKKGGGAIKNPITAYFTEES